MAKKGNIGRIINDRLNKLDKIPSDSVWKGIEAANIAPSIVVSNPWYFYAIAATVIPFTVMLVLQFSDIEISIKRKPSKNDSIERTIKTNSENNNPINSIVSNDSLEIGNTLSNESVKNKQINGNPKKTITNRQNINKTNILVNQPNTSSKDRKSEKATLNQQNSLTVKQINVNSKKAIVNRQNINKTNILVNQPNTSSKDKRKSVKLALPIPNNQKTPTQKPSNNIKTVITAKENHGSGNLLGNKSKDKSQVVIKQNAVTPIPKNTKTLSIRSDLASVSKLNGHVSDTKSTNLSQTVKSTNNKEIKRLPSKNLPSIKESNFIVKNRINYHYIKESNLIAKNSIDHSKKEKISFFKDRFNLSFILTPDQSKNPAYSMNLDVKLTNKLSFRTGFGYIAFGDFTSTDGNTTFTSPLYYKQIPLELKYKLLNKRIINIGINTGSSLLILERNSPYEIGFVEDTKAINYSANLGIEVDCKIYKKIHLVIEPSIKVLLDTYENSTEIPTVLNVRTGLAYHF